MPAIAPGFTVNSTPVWLSLLAVLVLSAALQPRSTAQAEALHGDQPAFADWLAEVRHEALERGIRAEVVEEALSGVELLPRVVQQDRSQAEFVLTFETYLARMVTPATVRRGQELQVKHRALLRRVSEAYGVQLRFILAIWGLESGYGRNRGTIPIIPALATLAYDPRRATFFRNQLFDALEMLNRGYIDLASMQGSWAGAMGQPQFMPSSYLAYAQDFDGDGRRDIWSSEADVFASIANYLRSHGWNSRQTWGREVQVPAQLLHRIEEMFPPRRSGCGAVRSMSGAAPLPRWQQLGVRRAGGAALPAADMHASLVSSGRRHFLVYGNYEAILSYNCAHHYALTIGTLADRIGAP